MAGFALGVDLGTTFTAAATIDDSGVPSMVGLGHRAMQIPSVVHIGPDGTVNIGEHAERKAATDPAGVVREFKRRIGDPTPIVVGGTRFRPDRLAAELLEWVIATTTERMGQPPSRITMTHPATWTDFAISKMMGAAGSGDRLPFATCPEPVAAAHHYASHHAVQVGDRICIYDLGGGTFDVCVLVKTTDGFEILGKPTGIAYLGGVDFDQLIVGAVVDGLLTGHPDLDPDDPGFAVLCRDCVEAKEALSTDVDVVIPVKLAGLTTSYSLTRNEFEAMIDASIESTMAVTRGAVAAAGVSPPTSRPWFSSAGPPGSPWSRKSSPRRSSAPSPSIPTRNTRWLLARRWQVGIDPRSSQWTRSPRSRPEVVVTGERWS